MFRKTFLALSCLGLVLSMTACTKADEGEIPTVSSTTYGTVPEISFPRGAAPEYSSVTVLDPGKKDARVVAENDLVVIDYYGKVWNGSQLPDSTITDSAGPRTLNLATPQVNGWRQLVGAKVGQRLLLVFSANDAYGELGSESLGISANQALAYVVDIVDTFSAKEGNDMPATPAANTLPSNIKVTGSPAKDLSLDATAASDYPVTQSATVYATGTGKPLLDTQIAVVKAANAQWGKSIDFETWNSANLSTLPVQSLGLTDVPVGSVVVVLHPATASSAPLITLAQVIGAYNAE